MKIFTKNNIMKGFTLVEILVVLGLFSSITILSLGSLFNVQSINTKIQGVQILLDNVNLSTQTILRDIRFGSDFYCSVGLPGSIPTTRKNCTAGASSGGNVLIFKSSDSASSTDRVVYYLMDGVLFKNEYRVALPTNVLQITSGDVEITSLSFYVDGAQTSDALDGLNDGGVSDFKQPLITVSISGHAKDFKSNASSTDFTIQTNISARELDK